MFWYSGESNRADPLPLKVVWEKGESDKIELENDVDDGVLNVRRFKVSGDLLARVLYFPTFGSSWSGDNGLDSSRGFRNRSFGLTASASPRAGEIKGFE